MASPPDETLDHGLHASADVAADERASKRRQRSAWQRPRLARYGNLRHVVRAASGGGMEGMGGTGGMMGMDGMMM